eukprot:443564-Prymnesium_polylepis.1
MFSAEKRIYSISPRATPQVVQMSARLGGLGQRLRFTAVHWRFTASPRVAGDVPVQRDTRHNGLAHLLSRAAA